MESRGGAQSRGGRGICRRRIIIGTLQNQSISIVGECGRESASTTGPTGNSRKRKRCTCIESIDPIACAHYNKKKRAIAFKELYTESISNKELWIFDHGKVPFLGPLASPFQALTIPNFLSIFFQFQSQMMLQWISNVTNKYVSRAHIKTSLPLGRSRWWWLDPLELRAYFADNFMMGIKRLSHHRSYWKRTCPFLFCKKARIVMSMR